MLRHYLVTLTKSRACLFVDKKELIEKAFGVSVNSSKAKFSTLKPSRSKPCLCCKLGSQSEDTPIVANNRNFHSCQSRSFIFRKMGDAQSGLADTTGIKRENKVVHSDEEWKKKLTPEEYHVCRQHGTERAWTSELLDVKQKGVFKCACCGADLFNSSSKFDSGSGWPSFYDVLKDKDNTDLPITNTFTDRSHGMVRTEVTCGKCDSHLGHVFNDGPQPTGLRYCINGVSIKFKPDKKKSEL